MQAMIYCKTESQGVHGFYVRVGGKDYFLFRQNYYRSNRDYFKNGIDSTKITDFSKTRSTSVKKTLEKLPTYIRYIEKEYDLQIYEKTKMKKQKRTSYKREKFVLHDYLL